MIARLLASLLFTACLAGTAQAQSVIAASSCVPVDTTIKFDRDKVNVASVQHVQNNVDMVTLNCPLPPFTAGNGPWALLMTYRDSTGNDPAASVRARLYRMKFGSTNTPVLAEIDSNDGFATNTAIGFSLPFNHTFDFSDNAYWVRVDLDRSSTSQVVIIHSVAVGQPPE